MEKFKQNQKYFSVKHLAERFDVSVQTIWEWSRKGELDKPVKLGKNTTRWTLKSVKDFEQKRVA